MQRSRKLLTTSAVLALLLFLTAGWAAAAEIAPDLAAKLEAAGPDEFVRVFISMEEQPFVSSAMGAETTKFILREAAERTQAPVLDYLQAGAASGDVKAFNSFWIVNVAFAEIRADKAAELAELPGVARLFADFEVKAIEAEFTPVTDIEAAALRWDHAAAVFAPDVWELGFEGQGVTVAVVDTGVDITHPELVGAMGGSPPNHEGYWAEFDSNGNQVPNSVPHDSDDHGTHVSGTVGGRNVQFQIGVAPKVTLAHGLIIPGGSGSFAQVLGGFQWVVDQGFDIINGSLGINDIVPEMAIATDNIYAAGVVPIFSNGNIRADGTVPPGAPGNTPSAIAIGAFDSEGEEADFNRGDIIEYPGYEYDEFTRIKPDISAPGVDILSSIPDGYAYGGGTSMSAPHAAGVAALILSAAPNLTVDEVKQILYETTGGHQESHGWADIPTKDVHFGWGRINALRAVQTVAAPGQDAQVQGVVMSQTSRIAGATITFEGPHVYEFVTDEQGEFAGEVLEGYYTVTMIAEGYLTEVREERIVSDGQPHFLNFFVQPAPLGLAVGTVQDEMGAPMVGVAVTSGAQQVETDDDGQYELSLTEGTHGLVFYRSGFFPETVEVKVVREQAVQADVTLAFGFESVYGVIEDEDGNPIAGATAFAGGETAAADAEGRYALHLPAGEYDVTFAHDGYVSQTVSASVSYGEALRLDGTLPLNVGVLKGTVTNLDDEPLADAYVSIPALDVETTTDEAGEYVFEAVTAGEWRMSVDVPGHWGQQATVLVTRNGETVQDFRLEPFQGLSPFHNNFDTALEQSQWEFVNHSGLPQQWHFTQERSISAPFSAWHGFVNEDGVRTYPQNQEVSMLSPVFDIPEDVEELWLSFDIFARIWGSATQYFAVNIWDIDTTEGWEVYRFADLTGPTQWFEVQRDLAPFAGRSVFLQFYFISNTSVCAACGDDGIFIDNVIVGEIDPASQALISGTVRDEAGDPVAGALVVLVEEAGQAGAVGKMVQTTTGEDGRYEIRVAPGGWTLQASKAPEFVGTKQYVYATPDEETTQDFTLEANTPPASVTGLQAEGLDGAVRLSWDANTEEDLAGYIVSRSLDGEFYHEIGRTEQTEFVAEGLQNGYTYYFRVAAVDIYNLTGEEADAEATPTRFGPTVERFDVQPRTLSRGGSLVVHAALGHTDEDATMDVTLEATRGSSVIGEWTFADRSAGDFEAVVDTVDMYGMSWPADVYGLTLHVADGDGATAASGTVHVMVLPRLPGALQFLLGNNPFDPTREAQQIEFALPSSGHVTVTVHTLDGRAIATLLDATRDAGQYVVFWDGSDDAGRIVLAGMYVVRVEFRDDDGTAVELTRHSVVIK